MNTHKLTCSFTVSFLPEQPQPAAVVVHLQPVWCSLPPAEVHGPLWFSASAGLFSFFRHLRIRNRNRNRILQYTKYKHKYSNLTTTTGTTACTATSTAAGAATGTTTTTATSTKGDERVTGSQWMSYFGLQQQQPHPPPPPHPQHPQHPHPPPCLFTLQVTIDMNWKRI